MMIRDENNGVVALVLAMLVGSSIDGEAMVNSLLATASASSGVHGIDGRLLLALEEHAAGILYDTLGLLLKVLGCGLSCLGEALALDVGEADVEFVKVRVDLIDTVAHHVDEEDVHHLLHLFNYGSGRGGCWIDLAFGYQVSRPWSELASWGGLIGYGGGMGYDGGWQHRV
jgi:hypothetical protein